MFISGNQIRAARALIGWGQGELAARAGLHRNAVVYWETRERFSDRENRVPVGLQRIADALEQAGVVAISQPAPGVIVRAAPGPL